MRRLVYDSIWASFGPGLQVVEVHLPGDQVPVTLTAVPNRISRNTLIELLGNRSAPLWTSFATSGGKHSTVIATYSSLLHATQVVKDLEGRSIDNYKFHPCLSLPRTEATHLHPSLHTATVVLTWDQPTLHATLSYPSSSVAHARAGAMNNRNFNGLPVGAYYTDQGSMPSIIISNLRWGTRPRDLKRFAGCESVSPLAPSYDLDEAEKQLQKSMSRFGPLTFHRHPRHNGGRIRATAHFADAAHAEAAVCKLQGTKQACIDFSRIELYRAYSVRYRVSTAHFSVVKGLVEAARRNASRFTSLRIVEPTSSSGFVCVCAAGTETAAVAQLRQALDTILKGEVFTDENDQPIWDYGFLASSIFRLFASKQEKVFVSRDYCSLKMRICGLASDIEDAKFLLFCQYSDYQSSRRKASFPSRQMGHVLADMLDQRNLATAGISTSKAVGGLSERTCPVCLGEAEGPVHLPCGHNYCSSCMRRFLHSQMHSETQGFPIRCIAEATTDATTGNGYQQCGTPLPMSDIAKILNRSEVDAILEMAFVAHIRSHGDTFQFCPTPDCVQVYRITSPGGSPGLFTCPSCFESTCTSCQVAHHGLSCGDYNLRIKANAPAFLNIKQCPARCGARLQKVSGCNHVVCPICKVHMCWLCMKTFPSGGVYAHLSQVHGEGPLVGFANEAALV